jgi:transformation/transcription domain-associated protein
MESSGSFAPDIDAERLVDLIVEHTSGAYAVACPSTTLTFIILDFESRLQSISELRDLFDAVRVSDSSTNTHALLARLLEVLRTEPPAFHKAAPDFQFRKALIDLIIRGIYAEPTKFPAEAFLTTTLYVVRHDNEENAVACLKPLGETARLIKAISAEVFKDLSVILQECCRNTIALVPQLFSEGSPAPDPELVRPAAHSIRTMHELLAFILAFLQIHRTTPHADFYTLMRDHCQLLCAEAPVQKKAREDYESMGNVLVGMAPNMPNPQEYEHLLSCQSRVRTAHGQRRPVLTSCAR